MKRHPSLSEAMKQRLSSGPRRVRGDRRGSTLLVVMALLGMLTLLGLLYFTFATQEQANATFFAEAAKHIDDPGDDIDAIFDAAVKQLVQGADVSQKNSVISWRHSILGTMLGKDLQPFSGTGVRTAWTATEIVAQPIPAGYDLLEPNDSPAAQRDSTTGRLLVERKFEDMPAGDVDYTYPDINNMFLAYKTYVWDANTGTRKLVLKPSFHRPELLRKNDLTPLTDWATYDKTTPALANYSARARLMRPHPQHLYVWRQGTSTAPEPRFLDDYNGADAAVIAGLSCQRGFPFHNVPPLPGVVPGTPVPRTQGVWSMTAPAVPGSPAIPYQYDFDNDGDGVPDGIWLDLDLPVLVRPSDSKTYLPMISFTVYDLDSLLNLNIHGNLSGDTKTNPTGNFGNNNDISLSSAGLGPNEVNPLHALDAIPGTDLAALPVTSDYVKYFGHNPVSSRELANMELWWSLTGRIAWPAPPSTAPPQIYAGRHGEANRLWRVLSTAGGGPVIAVNQWGAKSDYFPFAGFTYTDEASRTGGDDNRDENEGRESWLGGFAIGQTQPFVHPLPLQGLGRSWGLGGTPGFKQNLLSNGGLAANPTRWQRYTNMGVGYDPNTASANAAWFSLLGGNLMSQTLVGANYSNADPSLGADEHLVHDELEMTLDSKRILRPYDEPIETTDSIWLHMASGDRSLTGLQARVGNLFPANFQGSSTYPYPFEISQRFTTESWDIKQFSPMSSPDPLTAALPQSRSWEWNVDFDGDGFPEFPPQFDPSTDFQPKVFDPSSPTYKPHNAFGPRDPFRPQVRRLMTAEFGDTKEARKPMRLSINELLDVEHRPTVPGQPPIPADLYTDRLQYRPLTPHLTSVPTTPITALPKPIAVPPTGPFDPVYQLPPFPPPEPGAAIPAPWNTFTSEAIREFWARRDRQQMARDIYVLLYTLCGGNNSMNTTTQPGDSVYPPPPNPNPNNVPNLRRQMAQFAVNMVDALDRDNVITAFEYDTNLLNGWNLDDDFTTNEGGERDIVFGVEAQELTLSEVWWARQERNTTVTFTSSGTMDNSQTPFDESANEFNFLHLELRSISAANVPLAQTVSTAANSGVWRVLRDDDGNTVLNGNENAVELLTGVGGTVAPGDKMAPGSLFTIASADSSPVGSAALYIDYGGGATDFELVSPNKGGIPAYTGVAIPAANVAPDLDLLHTAHAGRFVLANGGAGDFLSRTDNPGDADTNIALQRRLNPYLPNLSAAGANPANPYVTVDEFRSVQRRELRFQGGTAMTNPTPVDSQSDAANRLIMTGTWNTPELRSQERVQPLEGGNIQPCSTPGTGFGPLGKLNSLSLTNQHLPAGGIFNILQPHHDRDFGSVIELFEIPLQGPEILTRILPDSRRNPFTIRLPSTFGQAVILQTEDRNGNGILDGTPTEDLNGDNQIYSNHYHRLLSLAEVPTRTHRQLGDPLKTNRVPGKLNLNGLRDRHVMAALLDDREIVATEEDTNRDQTISGGEDFNGDQHLGLKDMTGSDNTRDWWAQFLIARDGVDPTTGLPLPISGQSRPFRDLANVASITSTESSIEDTIFRHLPMSAAGRRLFELADEGEFTGNNVPSGIRHRLLAKIFGNSTTRSNVFVVFATIGMFECVELPTNAVRIGGAFDADGDGTPDTHRAVFIIDRSDAEDAFDKGSGTFDWKKLIKARQRIN